MMYFAIRSLIEPLGLSCSCLTRMFSILRRGVLPILSRIDLSITDYRNEIRVKKVMFEF